LRGHVFTTENYGYLLVMVLSDGEIGNYIYCLLVYHRL